MKETEERIRANMNEGPVLKLPSALFASTSAPLSVYANSFLTYFICALLSASLLNRAERRTPSLPKLRAE